MFVASDCHGRRESRDGRVDGDGGAGVPRLGAHGDARDRVARRVRLEVEQHEGAPGARLTRRRGGREPARVRRPVDEPELERERRGLAPALGERAARLE